MSNETQPEQPHIGTLNEGSLHADLKEHYWEPGDLTEAPLGGFVVDLLRTQNNKNIIIEIQTTSFASMRKKLNALLDTYKINIVYPIPIHTTLLKPDKAPRKSPKRGDLFTIFSELVSIPDLLQHPNLSFEAVLVSINKVQKYENQLRRNRGGYRTINTQLVSIHETHTFEHLEDFMNLYLMDFLLNLRRQTYQTLEKFHEVPLNRWPTVSAKREQLMKSGKLKKEKNT